MMSRVVGLSFRMRLLLGAAEGAIVAEVAMAVEVEGEMVAAMEEGMVAGAVAVVAVALAAVAAEVEGVGVG